VESAKSQVGLLRGYFEHRLAGAGLDTLSDDPPNPAQAKLGPLGQVIRPSGAAIAAAAGSKKKAKPKDAAAPAAAATVTVTTALAPTVGAAAPTVGSTVPGVTVGVIPGVVAGVVKPTTPVLSSPSLLSQLGGSATMIPPATVATAAGDPQPQSQTPKKKKATPGAGAGAGGAGGTGAGTVGGPGGGSTNKKRGRPPEGLPPVVLASA